MRVLCLQLDQPSWPSWHASSETARPASNRGAHWLAPNALPTVSFTEPMASETLPPTCACDSGSMARWLLPMQVAREQAQT